MLAEDLKHTYQSTLKHPDVEEPIDLWFYRPVGFRVALVARRWGITPNAITVASIFFGIACGVCLYFPSLWVNLLGVVCLVIADIGDSADGQLARLTGRYSKIGRILDGAAGDIWFAAIYLALALRLSPQWGIAVWVFILVAAYCHSKQASMADYYRQVHLRLVKGEAGSELDDAKDIVVPADASLIERVFLYFYVRYTRGQEKRTPALQALLARTARLTQLTEADRQKMIEGSRPLMPLANALTFNIRAIILFLAVCVQLPWLYPATELTLFNFIAGWMIARHENLCQRLS